MCARHRVITTTVLAEVAGVIQATTALCRRRRRYAGDAGVIQAIPALSRRLGRYQGDTRYPGDTGVIQATPALRRRRWRYAGDTGVIWATPALSGRHRRYLGDTGVIWATSALSGRQLQLSSCARVSGSSEHFAGRGARRVRRQNALGDQTLLRCNSLVVTLEEGDEDATEDRGQATEDEGRH